MGLLESSLAHLRELGERTGTTFFEKPIDVEELAGLVAGLLLVQAQGH